MSKTRRMACYSKRCLKGSEPHYFEGVERRCPVCGAEPPAITLMVTVHFLVESTGGPIVGHQGQKKRIACDLRGERDLSDLSATNQQASAAPEGVNCPKCQQSEEWLKTMDDFSDNENFDFSIAGKRYVST